MARIYLSGPMTGLPAFNKPAFKAAAEALRDQGHDVVNPADFDLPGATWAEYMRQDIAALVTCDAIYLLPGWEHSKGARLEQHIADQLGMRVVELEG